MKDAMDTTAAVSATRRRWLYAGVAVAAAGGGAALAWRHLQPQVQAPGPEANLWSQSFATPEGAPLAMAAFRGRPLVLNFWATWCPPCIEELPLLNRFYGERKAQGWQVLGVAVDQPPAVRKFLEKLPLEYPVAIATSGGMQLGRALGNLQGGLPFTVVLGADGRIRHRKIGQVQAQDLARWADPV
ncbi:MAG: TlpA family protein disulfide reductase [Comamonadaceae bacterium]|nr:TlpA family protein disulfide reductase [Comamonadaceae bacterium]